VNSPHSDLPVPLDMLMARLIAAEVLDKATTGGFGRLVLFILDADSSVVPYWSVGACGYTEVNASVGQTLRDCMQGATRGAASSSCPSTRRLCS
jgi:hypothetical protein